MDLFAPDTVREFRVNPDGTLPPGTHRGDDSHVPHHNLYLSGDGFAFPDGAYVPIEDFSGEDASEDGDDPDDYELVSPRYIQPGRHGEDGYPEDTSDDPSISRMPDDGSSDDPYSRMTRRSRKADRWPGKPTNPQRRPYSAHGRKLVARTKHAIGL